jgi:hypothetical protein
MVTSIERIGGSVLNLILGGLILWVGQSTFQHSGILAGVDEKFATMEHQFADTERRHDSLRKWLESVVTDLKDSTRSQFTAKDGDKLAAQVRQSDLSTLELERRVMARLGELDTRLAALETQQRGTAELASLQWQVAQLRDVLVRTAAAQDAAAYQSPDRVARGAPVFLPPVDQRRQ